MPRRPFLSCRQFRRLHAEYVDAMLSHDAAAACQTHLDSCADCAAHDVRIRRSLMALQALRPIEPSPDFHARLAARIARAESMPPRRPWRGSAWRTAGALLAASVALIAYAAMPSRTPAPVRLMPVLARAPQPAAVPTAPAVKARTGRVTAPVTAQVAASRSSARFEALPGSLPFRVSQEMRPSMMRISTVSYIGQ